MMENKYMISRLVLCTLTFLISFIVLMNEDMRTRALASVILAGVSLLAGFIATPISKRIMAHGNRIAQKGRRIFFYAVLFPVTVFFICASWAFIYFLMNHAADSQNFAATLGQAVLEVLVLASAAFFILVPYIQTLIVLLLGKLMKD